jgi:ribosomal-protein-alanine N-acetyltransferase
LSSADRPSPADSGFDLHNVGDVPSARVVPGEPGELEIAPVRWWHLGEIVELEVSVFGKEAWSEELFWSELAQAASRRYLAAMRDGRLVGYGGLATHGDESYVQTLGVDARARRAGVATRLLVGLLRYARAAGARSCGLEVRTDNTPAHQLYQQFGFVDVGIRRGYYQFPPADAFVMQVRPIDTAGYGALLDRMEKEAAR